LKRIAGLAPEKKIGFIIENGMTNITKILEFGIKILEF
jgi:hypothetical protein